MLRAQIFMFLMIVTGMHNLNKYLTFQVTQQYFMLINAVSNQQWSLLFPSINANQDILLRVCHHSEFTA